MLRNPLLEDVSGQVVLSEIITSILEDLSLPRIHLVIDVLDKYIGGLDCYLTLSKRHRHIWVKWIESSCN
jgi:hypothetical protein